MTNIDEVIEKRKREYRNGSDYEDQYLKDLRSLLDFLVENPHYIPRYNGIELMSFVDDAEELTAFASGGKWDKSSTSVFFTLSKSFGMHSVQVKAPREAVCEQVQVGEETIEVPDPDVVVPTVTVTVPVFEWICPDSILKEDR